MDFQEIDIEHFLFAAIPVRFQDTDPKDFEDFIAHLFLENGYKLEQTPYSGDFGADLIVESDGIRTAVQVKRYYESHKVGVQEINQVIGAKEYYTCDTAMMVTTSSYTDAAKELGSTANVIMWDWYRLQKAIQDTFLEGSDYYEYYQKYPVATNLTSVKLQFRLLSVDIPAESMQQGQSIVHAELTNEANQNLRVYCELPVYITHQRKQFSALDWTSDSFKSGVIYSQASVDLGFLFSDRQLNQTHPKDRIILTVHLVPSNEQIILEQKIKEIKKECFLVTFYFGRDTQIYRELILYRDRVLSKYWIGRILINLYYKTGSTLVKQFDQRPWLARICKPLVFGLIKLLGKRTSK